MSDSTQLWNQWRCSSQDRAIIVCECQTQTTLDSRPVALIPAVMFANLSGIAPCITFALTAQQQFRTELGFCIMHRGQLFFVDNAHTWMLTSRVADCTTFLGWKLYNEVGKANDAIVRYRRWTFSCGLLCYNRKGYIDCLCLLVESVVCHDLQLRKGLDSKIKR